jgi:threonine/homoserine/homoserine lactone efflux protein
MASGTLGGAISALLPLALAVAVSPLPMIAAVLILATPRGRANGPAMVAGWVAMLGGIGVVMVAGDDVIARHGGQATATAWLSLAAGAVLLVLAARQWQGRPRGGAEAPLPKWMAALDRISPAGAAAVGALAVLNPKNLVLAMAGAALVAGSGVPPIQQLAAYGAFVAIATTGVATPLAIYLALGRRARPALERLRHLLARHNAVILAVLFVAMAIGLIRRGLGW